MMTRFFGRLAAGGGLTAAGLVVLSLVWPGDQGPTVMPAILVGCVAIVALLLFFVASSWEGGRWK